MRPTKVKYTKELLEDAVRSSLSFAQVIRHIGLKQAGGTQINIKRRIKSYKIDTSHFLGSASNSGPGHVGGPAKKTWQEILVLRTGDYRTKPFQLRRAMIESGIEFKCCMCNNPGLWRGKHLRLENDHRNGNWLDDRRENLRFMCPNCHSQTETDGRH